MIKHIIPKKGWQRYEIRVLNSKKYDEEINLATTSIKNKLLEMNIGFK